MLERPNIVITGVGHSGTSILAHMIHALGWNRGDIKGAEHPRIARLNNSCVCAGGRLDHQVARGILDSLPTPWVIKDPWFVFTLPAWVPVLEHYRPIVVIRIVRERTHVEQSYRKRNQMKDGEPFWSGVPLTEHFVSDERVYQECTLPKCTLELEQVARAVSLFDLTRVAPRGA